MEISSAILIFTNNFVKQMCKKVCILGIWLTQIIILSMSSTMYHTRLSTLHQTSFAVSCIVGHEQLSILEQFSMDCKFWQCSARDQKLVWFKQMQEMCNDSDQALHISFKTKRCGSCPWWGVDVDNYRNFVWNKCVRKCVFLGHSLTQNIILSLPSTLKYTHFFTSHQTSIAVTYIVEHKISICKRVFVQWRFGKVSS